MTTTHAETLQSAPFGLLASLWRNIETAGKQLVAPEVLETSLPFGKRILNPTCRSKWSAADGSRLAVLLIDCQWLQIHAHPVSYRAVSLVDEESDTETLQTWGAA